MSHTRAQDLTRHSGVGKLTTELRHPVNIGAGISTCGVCTARRRTMSDVRLILMDLIASTNTTGSVNMVFVYHIS